MNSYFVFILITVSTTCILAFTSRASDKVNVLLNVLSDIEELVFFKNATIEENILSATVLQLQCMPSGTAGCSYEPDSVQCQKKGFDGISQQWECKANYLPQGIKFGKIKVSCEGFDRSTDSYHLAGSCGLKYTLNKDNSNVLSLKTKSQNGTEISPTSRIDLKDSIGVIVAGTIGGMILLACCITVSICYCLKCFCFKNCNAKNRGPKRLNYAFRPTSVMQTEIVYPPQPHFFLNINNDGGDVCNKELSAFASPETIYS